MRKGDAIMSESEMLTGFLAGDYDAALAVEVNR